MNKILSIILLIVVVIFLFPKPFISSPGYTTIEYAKEFERTKKYCIGFNYLKNRNEVAVDHQGENLCFGWLIKNFNNKNTIDLNKDITENKDKVVKDKEVVNLYTELGGGDRVIVGSYGDLTKLIASTNIPAKITYTIKYKGAAVVPDSVVKESTYTNTISVLPGKTVLFEFNTVDQNVDISYTYTADK